MNQLIIIGNGFDLAHGLKTSYNDFFEKTQEISRHFKPDKKGDMRTKIVSFDESKPLVPVG